MSLGAFAGVDLELDAEDDDTSAHGKCDAPIPA